MADHAEKCQNKSRDGKEKHILHDKDTILVHLVYHPFRRNTDSRYKQRSFVFDDDINELGKEAFRVIFLQ